MDDFINNGKIYYPETGIIKGTPYLDGLEDGHGSVVLDGVKYNDLRIKYNVNLGVIVLSVKESTGGIREIVLNNSQIDSVFFMGHNLIRNKSPEIENQFIEVLFNNEIGCFYSWQIMRNLKITGDDGGYYYENQKALKYLFYNNQLHLFKTKRQFINIFPEDYKRPINSYIKQNSIRFKRINSIQLIMLVEYCQKVITE